MRERSALLARLRERPETDVLIVGGGINGVGVLRDLAAQGIGALLVERGDICSGTSAAPSRLVHGGLRYLETGEFALVRESVHERETLLRNAPHLVRPIPTWVPLSEWTGGTLAAIGRMLRLLRTPGRKGALVVKLGLVLYDRFAGHARCMPRHRFLSARAARSLMPSLSPHLAAVAEYYDARLIHPERLALELVADAEADYPSAAAITYLAAERLAGDRVVLRDMINDDTFEVRAKVVVNAAGAWADMVDAGFGIGEKLMGGTKGSHLVVRDDRLASELGDRMLYFETADKRACLVYALDGMHVLLGTTDLVTDDPDNRDCTPAEVEYLLRVLTDVLPGRRLSKKDIVFTYAGVRPLPRSDAKVTGAITRDHKIHRFLTGASGKLPVLTLVGGKWTTYRACAAEIADAVMAELGKARIRTTDALAIGGGANWPDGGADTIAANLMQEFGLTEERAKILAKRYGTGASRIAVLASRWSDDVPLETAPMYTKGEVAALAKHERVTRLEDVILRRTLLPFEGLAIRACIEELGDVLAPALGWSAAKRDAEIEATLELMQARHGLRPSRSNVAEVVL